MAGAGDRIIEVDIDEVDRVLRNAPPPTPDDQSLLWDGRRLDSPEKYVAWLVEIGDMTPGAAPANRPKDHAALPELRDLAARCRASRGGSSGPDPGTPPTPGPDP
ncbi:hypothetical protein [Iamia sp.]|uniref:hypothetical protein n=1 Tax=Iamia sp. TaxID=2722710 RepID=UPI002C315B93|nr:hypothetical protein [Iamia sp.]HXH57437.1 hypothetical protein [Iamia sp.]